MGPYVPSLHRMSLAVSHLRTQHGMTHSTSHVFFCAVEACVRPSRNCIHHQNVRCLNRRTAEDDVLQKFEREFVVRYSPCTGILSKSYKTQACPTGAVRRQCMPHVFSKRRLQTSASPSARDLCPSRGHRTRTYADRPPPTTGICRGANPRPCHQGNETNHYFCIPDCGLLVFKIGFDAE